MSWSLIGVKGLSNLGAQTKDEIKARNLCFKDHYNQLYLASSFREPFL